MINLSNPLPANGVQVPVRATFTGVAGVPFWTLAHNSLFPLFKLFNDEMEFRVIFKQRRAYTSIKSVHVFWMLLTNNVQITWHDSSFTFVANVTNQDDLVQVVRFLERKQAPLLDTAKLFLQKQGIK